MTTFLTGYKRNCLGPSTGYKKKDVKLKKRDENIGELFTKISERTNEFPPCDATVSDVSEASEESDLKLIYI